MRVSYHTRNKVFTLLNRCISYYLRMPHAMFCHPFFKHLLHDVVITSFATGVTGVRANRPHWLQPKLVERNINTLALKYDLDLLVFVLALTKLESVSFDTIKAKCIIVFLTRTLNFAFVSEWVDIFLWETITYSVSTIRMPCHYVC